MIIIFVAYWKNGTNLKVGPRTQDLLVGPYGGLLRWDPKVGPGAGTLRLDPTVWP